ncbi:MAG: outer membrane beta-barrel protein [Bacteroidales bacterium]|nr:outer membrane beta-barrel protein [Bacteroidales bacterium]
MKKMLVILISGLMCLSSRLAAQNVTGKVTDEAGEPLAYVSAILRTIPDSTFVNGTETFDDGSFSLDIPSSAIQNTANRSSENDGSNQYLLTLSFIGYKTLEVNVMPGDIGTFVLEEDAEVLNAVKVIAAMAQRNASGYTVSLAGSDIVAGKQASDALSFLPGVTNELGTYKINGRAVSEVYINGVKLTNLNELENISADMIDKVKVTNLASSKQNASQTGGTISITLKKPQDGGYYGTLSGGADFSTYYGFDTGNVRGVINYGNKGFSLYDNFSPDYQNEYDSMHQWVTDRNGDYTTNFDQSTRYKSLGVYNRLSLGYQFNDNHFLGLNYAIQYTDSDVPSATTSRLDDGAESSLDNRTKNLVQKATLQYIGDFGGDRGTEMEAKADFYTNGARANSLYDYGDEIDASRDRTRTNMYKFSLDFTSERSDELCLEYGASVRYVDTKYRPLDTDRTTVSDRYYTSDMPTRTTGLTPIAYIEASGTLWDWLDYDIGLNFQLNRIGYEDIDAGSKDFKNQFGVSPTVQFMLPFDKNGKFNVTASYEHYMDDIPYDAISSTIRWDDPYNYTVGNPDLVSPTGDLVMLNFSLWSNLLNINASYERGKNDIQWETFTSETSDEILYTRPINMDPEQVWSVGAELNLQPTKWWRFKLSGNLEFTRENAALDGIEFHGTNLHQLYTMYNNFTFNHGWGGMIQLYYEPTFKSYNYTYHTVYNARLNIYKLLCKNRLQIMLDLNPLGNRRRLDHYTSAGNTIVYKYTTHVQSAGLSLVWRFSGGKSVKVSTVSSDLEYERVVQNK